MIYNHKGYELIITFDSFTGEYEGQCKELGIWLSSRSKDGLEYSFRERVEDLTN